MTYFYLNRANMGVQNPWEPYTPGEFTSTTGFPLRFLMRKTGDREEDEKASFIVQDRENEIAGVKLHMNPYGTKVLIHWGNDNKPCHSQAQMKISCSWDKGTEKSLYT